MRPCVNLVALLLTFAVLASALNPMSLDPVKKKSGNRTTSSSSSSSTHDGHSVRKSKRPVTPKIHRPNAVTTVGFIPNENDIFVKKNSKKVSKPNKGVVKVADNKLELIHDLSKKTEMSTKTRDTRRRRRTMNQAMMALLLAYKLKFATLVPTLLGGLILLVGNTALAGFFFALFAAVLGLKH